MERMEYDPEGGDYKPITEHETGATFLVLGVIMLIAGLGWMLYRRLGHSVRRRHSCKASSLPMWSSPWVLLILGFIKKKRQIN